MIKLIYFTTSVVWNWSDIAPITEILAHGIGGGGAGGPATGNPACGGGGKGGGYADVIITKGAETTLSITVGAGGVNTGSTNVLRAGGNSTVVQNGVTRILAPGGYGGAGAASNSMAGAGATLTAGTAIGGVTKTGGNGGTGNFASGATGSGGGGGAASELGNGGNAAVYVAGIGRMPYGGTGGTGVGDNLQGNNGNQYGGGGSGGKAITTTDRLGGNGAIGFVWFEYEVPFIVNRNQHYIILPL